MGDRHPPRQGFVFEARGHPEEAASVAGRLLGSGWVLEPLFPLAPGEPPAPARFVRAISRAPEGTPRDSAWVWEQAREMQRHEAFESVVPDLPSSAFRSDSGQGGADPHLPGSSEPGWARDNLRAGRPGELGHGGRGIVIVHPDTGYTDHPRLGVEHLDLTRDVDLLGGDADALDPLERFPLLSLYHPGHGTSVAGVMAARGRHGLTGVAPEATLIPIRTVKSVVQVFDSDVARAIHEARRLGAHIVAMSLGGAGLKGLQEAIDLAVSEGMVVMAAAGNQTPFVVYPARYPNCIAVAGSNCEDKPWARSARGSKVLVCTPGESIHCANYVFGQEGRPEPRVERHPGTSFAVAHLAGACALWLAHHGRDALLRTYGPRRLQSLFIHQVSRYGHRRPAGWDTRNFGVGILDVAALLAAPLPPVESLPEVSPAPGPAPARRLEELVGPLPPPVRSLEVSAEGEGLLSELAFLAAEHPEVRAELSASPLKAFHSPQAPDLLRELASPSLRHALGMD